jgi:hypothetical protein
MGYCQVGGSTQPCTPEDCAEFRGKYFDNKSPLSCFLLSVLGDERAILMTATLIYPAMIQFRDDILLRTPLGRHFVGYVDEFYEEAKRIARKDPALITEIVWLCTYVGPYVQAMLGQKPYADGLGETPIRLLASELRPGTYKAVLSVVNRFKARGSKRFVAALNELEQTLSGFVGLSPEEALRRLRRSVVEASTGGPGGSPGGRARGHGHSGRKRPA